MSALKDLRDLINVSRLTYREDDSDAEHQQQHRDLGPSEYYTMYNHPVTIKSRSKKKPFSSIETKPSAILAPIKSKTVPNEKTSLTKIDVKLRKDSYVLSSTCIENPSSSLVLNSRDSLLDRKSIPSVIHFNNIKKSLPPLHTTSLKLDLNMSIENEEEEEEKGAENENDDDSFTMISSCFIS